MDCFASSRGSEREVWRAERGKDKDTMQIIAYGLQMSRSRWMGCSSTYRIVVSAKFCWLMGPSMQSKDAGSQESCLDEGDLKWDGPATP